MKRQKDFNGLFLVGWAMAVLLAAAYFLVVWYLVNEAIPRRLLLALGVVAAGLAAVFLTVQRRRVVHFAKTLEHNLDDMLVGRGVAGGYGADTLLGKLQNKLARIHEVMGANAAKSAAEKQAVQSLVSDISHQVKTPIANIRMYSEILAGRALPPQQQAEFLQHIQAQADRLGFLTDAMVRMSRLETGVVQLETARRPVAPLLEAVAEGLAPDALRKSITLTVACPPETAAVFDERWTAEALHNIADNAIKYTPAGGHVRIVAQPWEIHTLITVADDGPGIPEAEQAMVFSRFGRGAAAQDMPGIGLGLHLAREIVTRQDGYMLLRSGEGQGSEFRIFLPAGKTAISP